MIVVIAILAAISMVMYSGLQARALDASRASTVANIQELLEVFYVENDAYPSAAELKGAAGSTTLGVPISALSPPENPKIGIRFGWSSSTKINNPTVNQYRFSYITHPNTNGSGRQCAQDQRCISYDLTYITSDGTPRRLTNKGNARGN